MGDTRKIHIAGGVVRVGNVIRQRCAWCGHLLVDLDLANTAFESAEDAKAAAVEPGWEPGALISEEGTFPVIQGVVSHDDGDKLPAGWCGDDGPRLRAVENG